MARPGNLFAGEIVEATAPRAMTAGEHYTLIYDTDASQLVFDLLQVPSATFGVGVLVVRPHPSDPDILIPVEGPFPWATEFSPLSHARAWRDKEGLVEWEATIEVGAKDLNGTIGLLRATDITVNTTDFLTIPEEHWSLTEVRDSEEAGGVEGKVTIAVNSAVVVPVGLELRAAAHTAPYNSTNRSLFHDAETALIVEPGGSVTIATGGVAGDTVCAVPFYHEPSENHWRQASQNLIFHRLEGIDNPDLPSFTTRPTISGTGKIGSALTLTYVGANFDTAAIEWLRSGVAIEDETGSSYTPAAADDVTSITARVSLTNAEDTVSDTSNAIQITYPAPQTSGSISDLTVDEEDGATLQFSATSKFDATPGSYSVAPPFSVISIDPATGAYSVDIDDPLAATEFAISKTNSGGTASQQFTVTIDPATPVITRPSPQPTSADVTVTEVTDPDEASAQGFPGENGHLKIVTSSFSNFAPTGFTCRVMPFSPADSGVVLSASSTFYTAAGGLVGATVTPSVKWVHTATGQRLDIFNCPSILIQGLDEPPPDTDFPMPPAGILNTAKTAALVRYGIDNISGGMTSGFSMVLVAYAAWAGGAAAGCDARLTQILRHWCTGTNSPSGASGYAQQHEDRALAVIAIASKIDRIWNTALTEAERRKLDLIAKINIVAPCAVSSVNRPRAGTLIGRPNNLSGNINFSLAYPCGIACGLAYFGSAGALLSFLDGFDPASYRSAAQGQGLSNIVNNIDRWDWSFAQVQQALNNPAFAFGSTTFAYSNMMGIYTANQGVPRAFGQNIQPGATANNGTGGGVRMPNGTIRGILASGISGISNRGQTGMCQEFQGSDANENNGPSNVRSSMSYVVHGTTMVLSWIIVGMVSGLLVRSNSTVQNTILPRMRLAFNDLNYKNTNGYNSYAHGGSGTNNENWRADNQGVSHQWSVIMSAFNDVIEPWLDAG
jgi:hypothetical protein